MTPQQGQSAGGLVALAQRYFDAAYAMDADGFAAIFDSEASITRCGEEGQAVVTTLAQWLEVVRGLGSPRDAGDARDDRILAITMAGDMAMLQLRLHIRPRVVTDMLSCLHLNGRWRIVQKVFVADPLI